MDNIFKNQENINKRIIINKSKNYNLFIGYYVWEYRKNNYLRLYQI